MTLVPNNTIPANPTDAELITLARSGNRQAFGQIVRRYQAMISGLVYAACGDLHRSEDVAQETFISAWKSLSGLRDAAKLPGWLCQIARRRLADSARPASAKEIQFSHAFESGQEPAAPLDDSATVEESELLWRTLSRIPQPYRETLVLYYRQEKSTAQVAAAMETSEDSVRQRLARGRQMLREEVAAMLEKNITRTAPTPQFTSQVVAALPALAAQTAGIGATAKGAAAVKGGALLTLLVGWIAPIGLLFNLMFGTVQDIRQAQTPRQRRLASRLGALQWTLLISYVIGMNIVVRVARTDHWNLSSEVIAYCSLGTLFAMALFTYVVFARWQMVRVLREQNLTEPPFPKLHLWQRMVFTLPVVAICVGWLMRLALSAGDETSAELIAAAVVIESVYFAWRLPQLQPHNPVQQTFETFTLAWFVIVIMLNWRLPTWIAVIKGLPLAQMPVLLPMWSINAAAIALLAWIVALTALSRSRTQIHPA